MEKRQVGNNTTVIMDGAHNEAKMRAFVDSFTSEYPAKHVPILLALKEDKNSERIAPLLKRIASRVIVTSFDLSQDWPIKSQDPTELATLLKDCGLDNISVINDPVEAFNSLMSRHEDTVIVTGSFYLISQLRKSGLL
jgi:dihydrofolate synthase/folylpolyglutamate synthase